MVGLYPIVTQPVYLILAPWFPNVTMNIGGGKKIQITATNLSEESYYIQSLKVNGQAWTQSWLSHEDLTGGSGAELEFVLGPNPASWDTGAVPPSPGHHTLS
jgi:putative alpha-1,2-mannosidase